MYHSIGKTETKGGRKGHSVRLGLSRGDKARGRAACVHKQLLTKRPHENSQRNRKQFRIGQLYWPPAVLPFKHEIGRDA